MEFDTGSSGWYVLMLVLGLAVGFAIGWVRKIRRGGD